MPGNPELVKSFNPPENFQRPDLNSYTPDKILTKNDRMIQFNVMLMKTLGLSYSLEARQRMQDLIFNNCFGRNYNTPNSASDFIGIPDPEKLPTQGKYANLTKDQLKNCIVVATRKVLNQKTGKDEIQLMAPGGFNDIFEAMAQTTLREAKEEINAQTVTDIHVLGQESNPLRDERMNVISVHSTGCVDASELKAKDDANGFMIIKLINDDGSFNRSWFEAGELIDVSGKTIVHTGVRADHKVIFSKLYDFWDRTNTARLKRGEPIIPLDQVLKSTKGIMPDQWYRNFHDHPEGTDKYSKFVGSDGALTKIDETPNVSFAFQKMKQILLEKKVDDAKSEKLARELTAKMVQADMLPLFPQAAVTADCLLLKGNNLVVHKRKDGKYSLPGSFFEPKPNENIDLTAFAKNMIYDEYHAYAEVVDYLGCVGGDVAMEGKQADERYPRLSHVFVAYQSADRKLEPQNKEDEIVEIPLFDANGGLSKEIEAGQWAYGHNKEIIPLLINYLEQINPGRKETAEAALQKVPRKKI